MGTLDLRKQLKHLYQPAAGKVEVVDVPEFKYAMVEGVIEPGCAPATSPSFQQAVEALYGVSYALKFMSKQRTVDPIDYAVMPLEALWWATDGQFDISQPGNWAWIAMIVQPDHVTDSMFAEACAKLRKKRPSPAIEKLRFEGLHEGLCVQTLHLGPYSEEPATIARIEAFASENGYVLHGKHHEIYLGDPKRVAPEKLKTILRYPCSK
ncbi:MAG: hypothetical protein BWY85_01772 [Firmicutes bacterium ADurb.Bin506]|jgi:hypothetical protein|nr:MAG: hypothetical protein BWY85_01772 [Firmicutes bacterium ADurb.Bin506]